MKSKIHIWLLFAVLTANFSLIPGRVIAQANLTTLYSLQPDTNTSGIYTNSGGAEPITPLIAYNNVLYGTASYGGVFGNGTIFKLNSDGTAFTVLHTFSQMQNGTNEDGGLPYGGLVLSGDLLCGTTTKGRQHWTRRNLQSQYRR